VSGYPATWSRRKSFALVETGGSRGRVRGQPIGAPIAIEPKVAAWPMVCCVQCRPASVTVTPATPHPQASPQCERLYETALRAIDELPAQIARAEGPGGAWLWKLPRDREAPAASSIKRQPVRTERRVPLDWIPIGGRRSWRICGASEHPAAGVRVAGPHPGLLGYSSCPAGSNWNFYSWRGGWGAIGPSTTARSTAKRRIMLERASDRLRGLTPTALGSVDTRA
jgi:hypothetical protein